MPIMYDVTFTIWCQGCKKKTRHRLYSKNWNRLETECLECELIHVFPIAAVRVPGEMDKILVELIPKSE